MTTADAEPHECGCAVRHNLGVPDLLPGAEFAGCRIETIAGRGGMGVVYRATQLSLARPVAVKLIASDRAEDPAFRERFERESRLAASIDHPNVIPVHAAGEEDGQLYLVMRYVRGTDLQALLAREGRLEPRRAAAIVAQVGLALDAAHAAGLVHRDVKPANFLISGAPGTEHVYLSDFGLTRVAGSDARLTDTGEWIGSVDFMSPEHLRGERTDARSDVYALGCVLFTALTGGVPFPRGTVPATLLAHLHEAPPLPSRTDGVSAQFDRVLLRALAKTPADRYPSAGDLGRAALAAAHGDTITEVERSVARGPAAPADGALWAGPPRETNGNGPAPSAATTRLRPVTTFHAPASPSPEPEPEPVADPERPAFVKVKRARRRPGAIAFAAGALAAVLAAAIALGAGLPGGGGGGGEQTGPVSADEVRDVVGDFASAYGGEDGQAMARTLARDTRRAGVGAADVQSGRAAVLEAYRSQFAANATTSYDVEELQVEGGPVGRAEGRYRVERDGAGPIEGRIVFGVVRERGRAKISLIAATPQD